MAAPLLSIDVDPRGAIAALDRLGTAVERRMKEVALVTANRIKAEAQGRVARRTGVTAAAITAEEARDGRGYVVYVKTPAGEWPNLDIGLEFGTKFMTPRPFLHVSAQLEEGPHRRRIEAAIDEAIGEAER